MKTSTFLKKVKKHHLATSLTDYRDNIDKERFLCVAIRTAQGDNLRKIQIGGLLRLRISEAIQPRLSVESWLVANGHAKESNVRDMHGVMTQAMFDYRHRWIDALIAEYKAQGD